MAATVGIAVLATVTTSSPAPMSLRLETEKQRIGPAVDPYAAPHAGVGRERRLELPHAVAKNESARAENLVHRGQDLLPFGLVFSPIVPHRYGHGPDSKLVYRICHCGFAPEEPVDAIPPNSRATRALTRSSGVG